MGAKGRRSNRDQDREEKENKSQQNQHLDDDVRISMNRKYASNRSPPQRTQNRQRERDYQNRRGGGGNGGNIEKNRDRNYRSGRNTMEFKNQNRNKNNDYDGRGNSQHSRNNSGNNTDRYQSSNSYQHQHQYDDEPVESISFTNSKFYPNERSNQSQRSNKQDRNEYMERSDNQAPLQQRPITGRQQSQQHSQNQSISQQSQAQQNQQQAPPQQQRYQLVSNEMPVGIHLDTANNQQNSQNTLLTTNHSLPISSSVISNPINQQAMHSQSLNQQPPMGHLQTASSSDINLAKQHDNSRPKRYSNQRQRSTGLESQQSPQPQASQQQQQSQQQRFQLVPNDMQIGISEIPIAINEMPIGIDYNVENMKYATSNAVSGIPSTEVRNTFNRTTQIREAPKAQPTPSNVQATPPIDSANFARTQQQPANAFARNQTGNAYIGIDYNVENMKYPPAINPTPTPAQFAQPTAYLQTAGPTTAAFLPQPHQAGPPPTAAVVPQMMNFVPAHPPIQPGFY